MFGRVAVRVVVVGVVVEIGLVVLVTRLEVWLSMKLVMSVVGSLLLSVLLLQDGGQAVLLFWTASFHCGLNIRQACWVDWLVRIPIDPCRLCGMFGLGSIDVLACKLSGQRQFGEATGSPWLASVGSVRGLSTANLNAWMGGHRRSTRGATFALWGLLWRFGFFFVFLARVETRFGRLAKSKFVTSLSLSFVFRGLSSWL